MSSGQVMGVAGLRVCRTFVRERIGRGGLAGDLLDRSLPGG